MTSHSTGRRSRPGTWSTLIFLAGVVAAPVRAATPDSTGTPTLAGVWTLDVKKSESAQEKMEAMRRAGGGPGSRMGGGMRGGGPRGGPGGMGRGGPAREGPGEGEPRDQSNDPERRLTMRPPASMLIEQTDSTVVLFEQGLPIEVLIIGLPQDKAGTVEPSAPHIVASWHGGRLLTLREDERGGRATQQFTLSADGKSLTLIIRREPRDDRPVFEIRREYQRDE